MQVITMYTDGACVPNPGPGGYGVVLIHPKKRLELSGGYRLTTNNRMEMTAVIKGLSALKAPCTVQVFSDSQYVINSMVNGNAMKWRLKGWMRSKTTPVISPDLWEQLIQLCNVHQVSFNWVRGHAGILENEVCDRLANRAATGSDLLVDEGYAALDPAALFDLQKSRAMKLRREDPLSFG